MEEQIVSFEVAKLAKEKGFNWKCRGYIHNSHFHFVKDNVIPNNIPIHHSEIFSVIEDHNNRDSVEYHNINPKCKEKVYDRLSLPTQSLLQRWLREIHRIHICIDLMDNSCEFYYYFTLTIINIREFHDEDMMDQAVTRLNHLKFNTYEEALEEALLNALKLIENEKEK